MKSFHGIILISAKFSVTFQEIPSGHHFLFSFIKAVSVSIKFNPFICTGKDLRIRSYNNQQASALLRKRVDHLLQYFRLNAGRVDIGQMDNQKAPMIGGIPVRRSDHPVFVVDCVERLAGIFSVRDGTVF